MKIEVFLNRGAENAANIRAQLDSELQALRQPGVEISTRTGEVDPGELGFTEVYQFIIDHTSQVLASLQLITVILQLSNAVLGRHGLKKPVERKDKSQAPVVINVNGNQVELPASDQQMKRYLKKIESGSPAEAKRLKPKIKTRRKKAVKRRR